MATVKVIEEGELEVPEWGCAIPYGQQRPEANDKFVESVAPNSYQARLSQAVRIDDHLLQPPKTFNPRPITRRYRNTKFNRFSFEIVAFPLRLRPNRFWFHGFNPSQTQGDLASTFP
jgi:hypothetical protein